MRNQFTFDRFWRWFHHSLRYRLYYYKRKIAYAYPIFAHLSKHIFPGRVPCQDSAFWNRELAGTKSFYFGGVPYVDTRNMLMSILIRYNIPHFKRILDIGCAGGELANNLSKEGLESYIGIDISDYAIRKAERNLLRIKQVKDINFYTCDLRDFTFSGGASLDVIVFSEVLYYLDVQEAVKHVKRISAWLRPNGRLCISMKDDPKSHAIFRGISRSFKHEGSMLFQYNRPCYDVQNRFVINAEFPRFLIAFFAPSTNYDRTAVH